MVRANASNKGARKVFRQLQFLTYLILFRFDLILDVKWEVIQDALLQAMKSYKTNFINLLVEKDVDGRLEYREFLSTRRLHILHEENLVSIWIGEKFPEPGVHGRIYFCKFLFKKYQNYTL